MHWVLGQKKTKDKKKCVCSCRDFSFLFDFESCERAVEPGTLFTAAPSAGFSSSSKAAQTFPPRPCSGCVGTCFHMCGRSGYPQVSSPSPPWINLRDVQPPLHHHPWQLLSFFHFRVSICLDCPSVNIAWVAISDGVILATPQVPTLLLWPCLIHWYMKLVCIYLTHTCAHKQTHTHTWGRMGGWSFSAHPFNLWASCDGTWQFPLKHLCTLWPLMTFLMVSAPVCIAYRDCRRSHQGPVTQLRLQTRGITKWVLVM